MREKNCGERSEPLRGLVSLRLLDDEAWDDHTIEQLDYLFQQIVICRSELALKKDLETLSIAIRLIN